MIKTLALAFLSILSASATSDWVSISKDVQFQRHLNVDSNGIFYTGDAQAWRYLGFYSDCEGAIDEDGDGQTAECQRYLLWAAYVDMGYAGTGIGEYQIYDKDSGSWSKCTSKKRCVKMDCHESSKNFELLGFYKVANYNDWLNTLGTQQASCDNVDSSALIYEEMLPEGCVQSASGNGNGGYLYYALKPSENGAIDLGLYMDSSCSIEYTGEDKSVYNIVAGGNNNRALEQNNNNQNQNQQMSLATYVEKINEALEQYSTCTPCRAYNIPKIKGQQATFNQYRENGGEGQEGEQQGQYAYGNGQYQQGQQQQGQNGQGGQYANGQYGNGANGYQTYKQKDAAHMTSYDFMCTTSGGMRSPNQCSLFSSFGSSAHFSDVVLAAQQGSIKEVTVKGIKFGGTKDYALRDRLASTFFAVSILAFFASVIALVWRCRKTAAEDSDLEQPLVANDGGVQA